MLLVLLSVDLWYVQRQKSYVMRLLDLVRFSADGLVGVVIGSCGSGP